MGSLPLGFRFPPTDEELIDFFLRFEINGQNDHVFVIREMELRDLPDFGTMSQLKGSPYRDLETKGSNRTGDDEESCSSPLNIPRTKNASIERLHRWRHAALVLNASRRFRYTLDLKKEEERKQVLRKIRAHAQAIRAAYLFKAAGEQQVNDLSMIPTKDPEWFFFSPQDQKYPRRSKVLANIERKRTKKKKFNTYYNKAHSV